MQVSEIYISRILDADSAFGAQTDTGEQVFIPPTVTRAINAEEGDIVTAKLISNTHPNSAATPWVAVHASRNETAVFTDGNPETIDGIVMAAVLALGYGTTAEIAREVGEDVPVVRPALDRLFRDGALAKALVYARDGQDRASFCMWAEEASCFVGEAHND